MIIHTEVEKNQGTANRWNISTPLLFSSISSYWEKRKFYFAQNVYRFYFSTSPLFQLMAINILTILLV